MCVIESVKVIVSEGAVCA